MRLLLVAASALLLTSFAPLLPASAAATWHAGRNDYTIAMSDGATIDASMVVPQGTAANAKLPAIIVIHGYGGSKDVGDATRAANRGYVGFAYSTRGFGQSTGQMDVVGPRSIQDLKELVAWLKANGPVAPDKIGVTGCSYGGGHSLLIATQPDAGIATAVPCVPWSDLGQALRPNHVFKFSYTTGFYATGNGLVQDGCQPQCVKAAGTDLGRRQLYDTYLTEVHLGYAALATGVGTGTVDQFFRERSAAVDVGNIKIPIFIIQGLSDDLFPGDQALPFFQLIPTPEKKLYLGFIGHPRATASGPEVAHVENEIYAWFDYYLKGVGTRPFDPARPIEVAATPWNGATQTLPLLGWPTGSEGQPFALNGDGTLGAPAAASKGAVTNTMAAGIPDDPVLPLVAPELASAPGGTPLDTLVFRSAPLATPAELLGTPRAEFALNSTGASYQIAVKLYDAAPDGGLTLVTRGIWGVPDNVPGVAQRVRFDLQPYHYTFAAGHRLEAHVAASDFPAYEPERVPFTNLFDLGQGGSFLRLPLR